MSMLSAQCDKLRWLADNLEEHDSHMDEYVQAMRSAADTIWELRNDCVELRDENDKLRAERDEWHRVAVSKQDIIDHMQDARGENAKLRELVYDMLEDEGRGHNDDRTFREHVIRAHKYGIAKDIEVDE